VTRIAAAGVPVQVGGGYRTIEAVTEALEAGAARVLLGTAALDERFLATVVAWFGDRVAVAVDVRDGVLAVAGWTRTTTTDAADFAARCAGLGVGRLVATATARDGTLAGPDLPLLERLCDVGVPVVAAGGVASLSDVLAVRDVGCEGVVVGSALWRGTLRLEDALAATVTA